MLSLMLQGSAAGTQYAALVFYVYFVPSFNAFGHNYKVTDGCSLSTRGHRTG